jgi:hypothetical protein
MENLKQDAPLPSIPLFLFDSLIPPRPVPSRPVPADSALEGHMYGT